MGAKSVRFACVPLFWLQRIVLPGLWFERLSLLKQIVPRLCVCVTLHRPVATVPDAMLRFVLLS